MSGVTGDLDGGRDCKGSELGKHKQGGSSIMGLRTVLGGDCSINNES